MEITIWNKTDDINGVPASEVLEQQVELNTGDVFLVKENGIVTHIESVNTIRNNLKLGNVGTAEVISAYEEFMNQETEEPKNEIDELKNRLQATEQALMKIMMEGVM